MTEKRLLLHDPVPSPENINEIEYLIEGYPDETMGDIKNPAD